MTDISPSSKKALLIGSIGAMAETSDMQRRAYNAALQSAGLDWEWDPETYSELLEMSGGKDRLSMLSAATQTALTDAQIDAIHAEKTERACAEVRQSAALRPGVAEMIETARKAGLKIGFVTTTYAPNIDAILDAAELSRDDFDYIGQREHVCSGKPAPESYERALSVLGMQPEQCLAIEDTANSVMAAKRAGIATIATPGALTAGQDFWQADLTVPNLAGEDGALRAEVLDMMQG